MARRHQICISGWVYAVLPIAALTVAWAAAVPAQTGNQSGTPVPVKMKTVPVKPGDEASGERLFETKCAVCHGRDAKGDGPAAAALKAIAPDLTLLAKDNGGQFPAQFVMKVLDNGWDYPGHGTKEMPIWGPVFRSMAKGDQAAATLRARNLLEYLRSIQQK